MITTLTLNTARFGEIEYAEEDIITMKSGMIGFESAQKFLIINHKPGSNFRWFQNIEEPGLAFLIIEAQHYMPDYAPSVAASQLDELKINENTPRLVYTVVTIPRGKPEDMTINLAGPIVINTETRQARQIVVEDSRYGLKHPVKSGNATVTSQAA